jgi:hypothetical protein
MSYVWNSIDKVEEKMKLETRNAKLHKAVPLVILPFASTP